MCVSMCVYLHTLAICVSDAGGTDCKGRQKCVNQGGAKTPKNDLKCNSDFRRQDRQLFSSSNCMKTWLYLKGIQGHCGTDCKVKHRCVNQGGAKRPNKREMSL